MNGDYLHQVFIALQTHLLTGGIGVRFGNLLVQPAHQRMLAFQLRSGFLEQFADM